jgi:rRNA maturation endonuclease Nob1
MRFKRTGPNVASNIIEHRDRYGPFWSLEAVQGIKGIGALWVEDNKKKIRITPELRCWNCGRIIKLEQGQKSGVCPFCKRKWPKSTE